MLIAMAVHDTSTNNRTWMTKATLESLSQTVDWSRHRLIVVDNGSCEETLELYSSLTYEFFDFGETWQLIPLDRNYGTAHAINQAWRSRLPHEHVVKMDNDVVFHQAGWADWMVDVFERDPTIGIVGLKRNDLAESPWAPGDGRSTIRMLPHKKGQRWIIVEEVKGVIGTCIGLSTALLAKIGYLTQPGLYGYDDSLASARARIAGFKRVFLHGFEIDHIDPGGDAYCDWKIEQASRGWGAFNTLVALYEAGAEPLHYDGGFEKEVFGGS